MSTRRRQRGSAAVEFLLSVPFIVLFCFGIMDFARGFLSAQRGQRAARHVAWSAGRHAEDGSHAEAPDGAALLATHYQGRGGAVSASTTTEEAGIPIVSDIGDALDTVADWFGLSRKSLSFLTGNVDMTRASVTQQVSGLQLLSPGSNMTQNHWVSMRTYRESEPQKYVGWWDPITEHFGGDIVPAGN